LASLSAQTYPHDRCSILVIDDGRATKTQSLARCAAERDRHIQVHAAGRLPAGWLGKPRACWLGALRDGDADWLCFIDADVPAAPALLTTAVGLSERRGLDMLSLHPFQKLDSFWEQLVIPAGLLIVACAKDRRGLCRSQVGQRALSSRRRQAL
jgi:hypothetical protein